MGDIVNLRAARKLRARADRKAEAAENRVRFGRSKAETAEAARAAAREAAHVEGHRRERAADGPDRDKTPSR